MLSSLNSNIKPSIVEQDSSLGYGRLKTKKNLYQSNERNHAGSNTSLKDPVVLDDYSFITQSINPNETTAEGQCLLKTNLDQLKSFWLYVSGSDLTFYKNSTKQNKILYHTLVNTFVEDPEQVDNVIYEDIQETFWPLRIILPSEKTLVLHFRSSEEQQKWCNFIKERTKQKNIKDFYRLEHPLGKGKFGEVRRATHLQTSNRVAVKVIRKRDMKPIEIYQQQRETDILKMC